MKDFQKKVLNIEESLYVKDAEEKTRKDVGTLDPSFLFDIEKLKKFAVKRSEIEEKFNLKKSEGSSILTYLKKRLQPNTEVFSWDAVREQLYIFHMIPKTDLVLGYQVRNFKSTPKYSDIS